MAVFHAFSLFLFALLSNYGKSESIGDNGEPQYQGVGWYCNYSVTARFDELWLSPTNLPTCYQCFNYAGDGSQFSPVYVPTYTRSCPWRCYGSYCGSGYGGKMDFLYPPPNQFVNSLYCRAGCVRIKPCEAISNGYFTGIGTTSTNCPFKCNTGYLNMGYSCVSSCSEGWYQVDMQCVKCEICGIGSYRRGCSGSSAGDCTSCTNNY